MTESQNAPEPQPDEPTPKTAVCWYGGQAYGPGDQVCDSATNKVWVCRSSGKWEKTDQDCPDASAIGGNASDSGA